MRHLNSDAGDGAETSFQRTVAYLDIINMYVNDCVYKIISKFVHN